MQCLAYPYADEVSSDAGTDIGEMHFQAARDMIADLYDNHSLAAVQGLLIMASCSAMRGVLSAGWQYIGMAARMAHYLALEASNVGGISYPPVKEEMRRRTWTACLTLERLVWLSVEVPSIFANVPVRVRQHIPDNLWQSVWPGDRNLEQKGPFQELALCGYYKHVMVFYGKTLDYVRADNGIRMIINYQALDAEIDAWFLSLPTPVRDLLVPPDPHLVRADAPPHFWFAYTIATLGLHARGVLRKSLLNSMLSHPDRVVAAAAFALNADLCANSGDIGAGGIDLGARRPIVDANGLLSKILFDAISVADEHTSLIRHGLLRNPYLKPTSPHLSMGVYQLGLVYVIALGRAVTECDEPMIARCASGLAVHEQALGAWANIFSPARGRQYALKHLHATARSGRLPDVDDGAEAPHLLCRFRDFVEASFSYYFTKMEKRGRKFRAEDPAEIAKHSRRISDGGSHTMSHSTTKKSLFGSPLSETRRSIRWPRPLSYHHPAQYAIPLGVLLVLTGLSLMTFFLLRNAEVSSRRLYVETQCKRKYTLINDEVRGGTTILQALANVVTLCRARNDDWAVYASRLISSTTWNIVGNAILTVMNATEVKAWVAKTGGRPTERSPDGLGRQPLQYNRTEYMLITQDYPDFTSLGFDYYSDPKRRALAKTAASTRQLSISDPTPSIGGTFTTVVFFLPTFDNNTGAFVGGVAAGYYITRILPARESAADVYLSVTVNSISAYQDAEFANTNLHSELNLQLADKLATITCGANVNRSTTPAVILICGCAASGVLAMLAFWIVSLLRYRKETLINQMVADENVRLANVSEQAARQAAQMKSDFFANVSHELRTPLHGCCWMINFLSDTELTAEQEDYVKNLRISSQSLLYIINDVLDFSKIEAGKMTLEVIPFDIIGFLEQLRVPYSLLATHNRNSFQNSIEIPPHPQSTTSCFVLGDPLRLRQVMDNLINNAMKFSADNTVLLTACIDRTSHPPRLKFSVADKGIGLSGPQLDALFQPYVQADVSTTRRFGGTGLGLAITKRLVELMGGTIICHSVLSVGTTFEVYLPFTPVDDPSQGKPETVGDPVFREGFHVCIADDNAINQRIAGKICRDAGIKTTIVDNGQQVVDLFIPPVPLTCRVSLSSVEVRAPPDIDCILM
ncbi:hypothetical protein HDU86_008352 [Geranomyces michiganensis]|nr:hypothetical protein HDU86_008352 [Geranomyces michiganensis]